MAGHPTDLRYTKTHEWVRPGEKLVTIGITQFAADRLGTIGFAELPYAGELFRQDAVLCKIRGDAGAASIRMPFVGHVNAVNQALGESPRPLNADPYAEGWIARIEPGDPAAVDELMDAAAYEDFLAELDD